MKNNIRNNEKSRPLRSKDDIAVDIRSVSKIYRIYHEKSPSLKNTIIRGRRTTFEEFLALDDISFSIKHGQTIGLIGPNGSGKSTLLKLISNIIRPTRGEIVVNGPLSALLELGAGFHPDLTGKENIYINAAILGMRKRDIDAKLDDIIKFSELEKFIDTPVKNYSSGMYMRLGFSVAINVNPDILLVDEVLAVGDQAFQAKCYKVIYDFMKRGKTIIIVSHDLETIADLCSSVVFLRNGKIQEMGKPLETVSKYRAYVEEIEKKRIIEQQKSARKKIFKSVIEKNRKILNGEEISRLSNLSVDGQTINRFGSGEAEITGIRILDDNDNEIGFCEYGNKIKVVYDVVFKAKVEEPIFGIRITDHRQNIVYGTNTRLQRVRSQTYNNGDRISIEFVFVVTMMGGLYSLSPAVGYNDSKTYCDWVNDMLTFDVMHNNIAEGICDLAPVMRINKK
ncbi:MAG: ABC transporter ATP-binding protein [Actinomycetota bacterium]|nr:MAG: ABC transporter ATP-binding protein [Actinomycetota bacterium]